MNTPINATANANLFSRLFDNLDDPARLAIETADGKRISYGDLIGRSGQIANLLVARGVKIGDRVAVQVEKSVQNLILYLAVVRAGAIYLPLNTAYTLNELTYFITDAEPSLVVCDPAKADGIRAIAQKVNAKVETLDANGNGSLTDAADREKSEFTTVQRARCETRFGILPSKNCFRPCIPRLPTTSTSAPSASAASTIASAGSFPSTTLA